MKEFIEKLIGRLEERKMNLIKNFVLANVAFSSKQKALDRINEIDGAIEIVNQLAEEYNNGWIPCSERLPSERDWYLAVFKEGDSDFILVPRVADYKGKETVCTTNEGWLIVDLEDEIRINAYYKKLVCIAWMPLPAPYIPKQEEQKGIEK